MTRVWTISVIEDLSDDYTGALKAQGPTLRDAIDALNAHASLVIDTQSAREDSLLRTIAECAVDDA